MSNKQLGPTGGQRVHFREVLRIAGHVLRVDIITDSYPDQAHARIERWHPEGGQWHVVDALLRVDRSASYKTGVTEGRVREYFRSDRDKLIRLADDVLNLNLTDETLEESW